MCGFFFLVTFILCKKSRLQLFNFESIIVINVFVYNIYECNKWLEMRGFRRQCEHTQWSWTFFRLYVVDDDFVVVTVAAVMICFVTGRCRLPGNLYRAAKLIVIIRFCELCSDANKFLPKMFIDPTWSHCQNVFAKRSMEKNKKNSRFYSVLEKIHFRITTLYSHSFLNQIQILSNTVILHLKRQSETETRIERVKEREYYNNAPALLFITLYIYKWIGALHRSCFAILWFWLVYIFSPLWF